MQVTFLIGNGFDVNLGLKTQYTEFYPTYFEKCEQLPDDSCVKKFCEKIKKDYENWSNFELAFSKQVTGTHQEVGEIIADFNDKFADYLHEQCEMCNYDLTQEMEDELRKFILEPYLFLERGDAQTLRSFYQEHQEGNHTYNFVSFNYTDTLDKLLSPGFRKKLPDSRLVKNVRYQNVYSQVLHLHGSIEEGYIIIGIDSLEQFASDEMKVNLRLGRHCVKSTINKQYGYQEKERSFINQIERSDVVCVYGMSFGETDRSRWNVVSEWLRKRKDHKLIIYKYNPGFKLLDRMSKGLLLDAIDETRDEYLKLLGFEENVEEMYNQVFVADSAKTLKFKVVEKDM